MDNFAKVIAKFGMRSPSAGTAVIARFSSSASNRSPAALRTNSTRSASGSSASWTRAPVSPMMSACRAASVITRSPFPAIRIGTPG
ncbi:hypothetical protein LAUMK4_04333 [Mycobacterium persicum]|uniref:Uncharacterized protein n=1 Tax=Mycobacterium persicum TaxID=1487726 RepID=A0ABY6RNE2_9MYCO|nr:hypothetical protein LAUMK4_04333 [Mycobacterium persicum]